MWRAMRNLFLLAVLAVFIAWMTQDPGALRLEWRGYELRTSLFVALAAIVLAAAFALLVARLLSFGLAVPRQLAERRRARRLQEACRLFCEAMTAAAAQNKEQALMLARKGMERMDSEAESDLALLLATRIAHLAGDGKAAGEYAQRMLARPGLEFVAARSLFRQAQERNDNLGALEYARRALSLRKDAAWAARAVFEHAAARKQWWEALAALDVAQRAKAFEPKKEQRCRALILGALAAAAEREERFADGWKEAREAVNLLPDFAPLVALAARLRAKTGKPGRGEKLLETAWQSNPHPALVEAWTSLHEGESPQEAAKRMENLTRHNPAHPESRIALARSRITTREWAVARSLLQPLVEAGEPERRVCLLMAQIEAGMGKSEAADGWHARASSAPPPPRWHCQGYESDVWQPVCPTCDVFDALEWGVATSSAAERRPTPQTQAAAQAPRDEKQETAGRETAAPRTPPDDPGPKLQDPSQLARDAGA